MKARLTALILTLLFLWGNVQASSQPSSFIKSYELKVAPAPVIKWFSSEKSLGEDEFTYHPATILLNFSTTFVLRATQRPIFTTSFAHIPSRTFILYRVLRN